MPLELICAFLHAQLTRPKPCTGLVGCSILAVANFGLSTASNAPSVSTLLLPQSARARAKARVRYASFASAFARVIVAEHVGASAVGGALQFFSCLPAPGPASGVYAICTPEHVCVCVRERASERERERETDRQTEKSVLYGNVD